jgi:L-fuculose-phosphate aldolase
MHPENEIVDVLKRLYTKGLTTSSGGNLSMIDDHRSIWITPAAIDKGNLTVNDLVKVTRNGNVKGRHKPSSEYPLHQAIYESCPEIKAIIHAHPPFIVAYCITKEKLNTKIQPDIFNICGEIGKVSYSCPGSEELANAVAAEFKKGNSIVMLENHGIVVGCSSITEAYTKIVMLNICAEASILAKQLGNLDILNSDQLKMVEKPVSYLKKYHLKQSLNYSVGYKSLLLLTKRAYKQNLLTGNLGSISVRKNESSAIVSMKFTDWEKVQYEDYISLYDKEERAQINNQQTIALYKRIYEKHTDINCIIHSYAPACFAFSLSDILLDIKTVPESYIILRDVINTEYEDFFTNIDLICDVLSNSKPLVFMKNNGLLVVGNTAAQAFDRLEVAEYTAKSIINTKSIGVIKSITQDEIDKINRKYPI